LRNLILEEGLSVREAEGLAAVWKETGRFPAGAAHTFRAAASDGGAEADSFSAPYEISGAEDKGAVISSSGSDRAAPLEGKSRAQSARLLDIQARIHAVFRLPVRVIGKETKGRISLAYNSREDLEAFLAALEPLSETLGRESEDAAGNLSPRSGLPSAPGAAPSGDCP
jgi:hypothetical protein